MPTQELARLSLILKRIEGTDKLRLAAGARGGQGSQGRARRGAGAGPGTAQEGPLAGDRRPHRRGRGGVSLSASAPGHIGAGRPVESCGIRESHLIPLNPGESRPENVSEASRPGPAAPGASQPGPAAVWDSPMMSRRAPDTSWPDQPGLARTGSGYPGIRPSTRPTILRRSWPQEMPGTSPGMTRRVGRSDGSHPQGRRRPQPAPPLRPLGGAPVRTRTGSAERDRASVLIERFPWHHAPLSSWPGLSRRAG